MTRPLELNEAEKVERVEAFQAFIQGQIGECNQLEGIEHMRFYMLILFRMLGTNIGEFSALMEFGHLMQALAKQVDGVQVDMVRMPKRKPGEFDA